MATEPTNPIIRIAENDTTLPSTGLTNKLEPITSVKQTGFDANILLSAENLNYILDNFGEWLQYSSDELDDINSNIDDIEAVDIIAGDGITGGGDISSGDMTLSLTTPSTVLDGSTTNAVSPTGHTHELSMASNSSAQTGTDTDSLMSPATTHAAVPYTFSPSSVGGSTESVTLPNGLIMKTAIFTESANNSDQKTWVTPFPNGVMTIQVTPIYDGNTVAGGNVRSYDVNGLVFSAGDAFGNGTTAFVFAIGY